MFKKFLKVAIASVFAFNTVVGVHAEDTPVTPITANATTQVEVYGEEWGPGVRKVVLHLDKTIKGESVSAEDFKVVETKNGTEVERTIVDAYVSNASGVETTGNRWRPAQSEYVTVELLISPSEGNPLTWSMATWRNTWPTSYSIVTSLVEGAELTTTDKEVVNALDLETKLDVSDHTTQLYPQLDGVTIDTYEYTAEDETKVVIPYGFYEPANDGHKNGIFVWNHGIGEGGVDPKIAMYGNEVTALWDEEFQDALDGCYVLAAQVPNDGKRDANRADAIVQLVKDLAAENSDIDLNRVYVGGCSAGGGMTSTIVNEHADFFAAALPICPAGTIKAENVGDLPLWYIHAKADGTVPYSGTETNVKALREAEKEVHTSIFDTVVGQFTNEDGTHPTYDGHWSWVYFFNNECKDENDVNCFEWLADQTRATVDASATQIVEVLGEEYGAAISKSVLHFDQKIKASSVSAEDFVVVQNLAGNVSNRTILDAYTSNAKGAKSTNWWGQASDSEYVTIVYAYNPNEGNPLVYSGTNNFVKTSYYVNLVEGATLANTEGAEIASINVEAKLDVADYETNLYPAMEGVSIDTYTEVVNEKEVVVPYGFFQPSEDGHKNAILIWNHGAGEGGTNPLTAMYANEVTALFGSEFQDIMDGCYVIVPQVPRTGESRTENRAIAIMNLVTKLAAENPDIDLNRVLVAGCSAGGGMTCTMLKTNADFFAAAVPICPAGNIDDFNKLDDTPVWLVHAENDTTVRLGNSTAIIEGMKAAGLEDNLHYSFFPDVKGEMLDPEGNPYEYNGHWSWVYFDNNACFDDTDGGQTNLWEWLAEQTRATYDASATQIVEVIGEEYGAAISKSVLHFDKTIKSDSLSVEDFTVVENLNGKVSNRTILDVYTSNASGARKTASWWNKNTDSEYVTIVYDYSPTEGNPLVYSGTNNFVKTHYYVNLNEGATIVANDGTEIDMIDVQSLIDVADYETNLYPAMKNVTIDTYTEVVNEKEVVVPYGFFQPSEDGHKNPILIWNHGAGEGGTNPLTAMYANEVTALFGSEFQDIMDGCYVIVPQVPRTGESRTENRAIAIMNLVTKLAAENPDIDLNRVLVAGCSAGGGMTCTMLKTNADFFAAAVPICPAGNIDDFNKLDDTPVWLVHAENDPTVGLRYSEAIIEGMKGAGLEDNLHYSFFPDVKGEMLDPEGKPYEYNGHWSWVYFDNNACFDDKDGGKTNLWEWLAEQSRTEFDATGTQRVEVIGEEWGAGVTKTIVKLDKVVKAYSVSAEDFDVVENNDGKVTNRTIVAAYVSDENGNKVETDSQYITIEMAISPSEGNPINWDGNVWRNTFAKNYRLYVDLVGTVVVGEETVRDILVEPKVDVDDETVQLYPQMENVETGTYVYTTEEGKEVVIPYGFYTPETDKHTNGIIIWNHGIGEGGTDPKIAMYGNEVTALFGEEFQEAMDGCYVLAAQVPNDGGRDADRADAIVQLVKDLAAQNKDIDLNRVYVAGCSAGGGMTTVLVNEHADFFAAAVPICPAGSIDPTLVGDLPVWFIHAEADKTVGIQGTKDNMAALKEAGKEVYSSLFDTVVGEYTDAEGNHPTYDGHWSWVYFFNGLCKEDTTGQDLWAWLATQTNAPVTPDKPAETGDFTVIAPYAILAVSAAGAYVALRRKED